VSDHLSYWNFALRLLVGSVLGLAIGFERQWRQRAVGMQTSALVSTGSTLFALISSALGYQAQALGGIVTGVGFLAGGVILKEGLNVRGLNTAATIWATAAVGALCGVGLFYEGLLGAAAVILVNMVVQPIGERISHRAWLHLARTSATVYRFVVTCAEPAQPAIRKAILETADASPVNIRSINDGRGDNGDAEVRAELSLLRRDDRVVEHIASAMTSRPDVISTSWSAVTDE
jgi:putative Mg2+ transporter-C (MgtC) family protein